MPRAWCRASRSSTVVGGGSRDVRRRGREVLDGYGVDEMAGGSRSGAHPVAEPPRRTGATSSTGERHQLPLTSRSTRTRSTASSAGRRGTARAHEPHCVVIGARRSTHSPAIRSRSQLEIEYALSASGLIGTNDGDQRRADRLSRTGAGASVSHARRPETVDDVAASRCRRERRSARTSAASRSARVAGRRDGARLPLRAADRRDEARQRLHRPRARRGGRRARRRSSVPTERRRTLWVDEGYRYLMLFTGDISRTSHVAALAVEPMTCPPNAFRSGEASRHSRARRVAHGLMGPRRRRSR